MKSGVLSTLVVLLLVAGLAPAHAQRLQMEPCKVLRRDGAAVLQHCGRELRSFALSMNGTERTAVQEHTNKFRFSCRPGFCQDEPDITGWFIDPKGWTRSPAAGSSTVVMVVADADVGLMITFQGSDPKDVLDFAVSSLRVFSSERGRGDAVLFERWFR